MWKRAVAMAVLLVPTLLGAPPSAIAAPAHDVACPVEVPSGTRCGRLVVAQRRDVPGSRTIEVGFAVWRSTSPERRADPVVFTSGGPGSRSEQLVGFLAGATGGTRDVVVVEQRGSRYSEPHLDCPEVVRAYVQNLQERSGRTAGPYEDPVHIGRPPYRRGGARPRAHPQSDS